MNLSKLTLALVGLSAFVSAQAAVVISVDQNTASLFSGTFSIDNNVAGSDTELSTLVTSFTITSDSASAIFSTPGGGNLAQYGIFFGDLEAGNASGSFGAVNYSFSFTGGDTATGSFSFTPVPEPSEYAAIAGAGLIGFAAWRRSRKNLA